MDNKKQHDAWKKKIPRICLDPQHNPPGHMVITEPYIHRCPSCGREITLYPNTMFM